MFYLNRMQPQHYSPSAVSLGGNLMCATANSLTYSQVFHLWCQIENAFSNYFSDCLVSCLSVQHSLPVFSILSWQREKQVY